MDSAMDFDFTDDKIKQFLENKLSELQSRNTSLRTKLTDRQKLVKSSLENPKGDLQIVDTRQKIIGNQYVVALKIENTGQR